MTLPSTIRALLEMQAHDNGFDRQLPSEGDWLVFASTKAPLKIWLTALGEGLPLVALSMRNVAKALGDHGMEMTNPVPPGAVSGRMVKDIAALHHLLRRAFQLARALPDEPLVEFNAKTAKLPRTTEVERLVVQRIGQDIFRASLLEFFDGRCAVTGLSCAPLLRASHIRPWAECDTDAQRLDVFNGLLLAATLDAAFDQGLATFDTDGAMVFSPRVSEGDRALLGLPSHPRLSRISAEHESYLSYHRKFRFKENVGDS